MSSEIRSRDVVVVGAGPAGIAAACTAAECGRQVTLVDDSPAAGGQIWRGEGERPSTRLARSWLERLRQSKLEWQAGFRMVAGDADRQELTLEGENSALDVRYRELILATGARERFLPFPGWTLPNVVGAGGLLALVKSGLSANGKRIVVAGTGPLLPAVAAALRKRGGQIVLIAEQAPRTRVLGFAAGLAAWPSRLWEAVTIKSGLLGVPYRTGSWIEAAEGDRKLSAIRLRQGGRSRRIACEYLAIGYGLVPNVELAVLLGCCLNQGLVQVDEFQRSSIPHIYCAGEITGIGGVELALAEGQIAGLAVCDRAAEAEGHFSAVARLRRFQRALEDAFALRPELRALPDADTIICRCEDVRYGRLRDLPSWRHAKLHTRCGMGPCQGRVCGPALEYLCGWRAGSVRPPLLPARVAILAGNTGE